MSNAQQIEHLYVLAGGASTRFGSDKALAEVEGVPMICSVAESLRGQNQNTTLVTGSSERYTNYGFSVITDQPAGVGPIGGLSAALSHRLDHAGPGWLALASCDLIRPKREWLEQLTAHIDLCDRTAIAYRLDYWEPMLALYHTDLQVQVEAQIQQQHFSMQRLLNAVGAYAVEMPMGLTKLPQANTPKQLIASLNTMGGV